MFTAIKLLVVAAIWFKIIHTSLPKLYLPINPIHCEFQPFKTARSKGPFFDFRTSSPYSFFNALASFHLTFIDKPTNKS